MNTEYGFELLARTRTPQAAGCCLLRIIVFGDPSQEYGDCVVRVFCLLCYKDFQRVPISKFSLTTLKCLLERGKCTVRRSGRVVSQFCWRWCREKECWALFAAQKYLIGTTRERMFPGNFSFAQWHYHCPVHKADNFIILCGTSPLLEEVIDPGERHPNLLGGTLIYSPDRSHG